MAICWGWGRPTVNRQYSSIFGVPHFETHPDIWISATQESFFWWWMHRVSIVWQKKWYLLFLRLISWLLLLLMGQVCRGAANPKLQWIMASFPYGPMGVECVDFEHPQAVDHALDEHPAVRQDFDPYLSRDKGHSSFWCSKILLLLKSLESWTTLLVCLHIACDIDHYKTICHLLVKV